MQKRITITISEGAFEKAKQIARKRKITLSAFIESELDRLCRPESGKKLFSEYLNELPAPKNIYPISFNFKQAYLEEKSGT